MKKTITRISDSLVRVHYEGIGEDTEEICFSYEGKTVLRQVRTALVRKEVYRTVPEGEFVKKDTANGEVSAVSAVRREFERYSHAALAEFEIGEDELLLGLGQYEDGLYDYRGRKEYLYQSNMRIAIPLLVTTGHYAVFMDTQSNMVFSEKDNVMRFEIDTTDDLSYYIITGKDLDALIAGYQQLTGKASPMPDWVFGYIQSKERYKSGAELLSVAEQFGERKIPVSCLVQDWYSWREGLWGEKTFDLARYPDLKGVIDSLHDQGIRFMVSVWPNMSPQSADYREFEERGMLLPNSNTYDAFSPEAGALYFEQCKRQILSAGADALWCDNAEPFSDADWSGEKKKPEEERYQCVVTESQKSMPWEKLNAYALYHARNIYENWLCEKSVCAGKKVVNLIRSAWAGSQAYGTIVWSGDITAKWSTMRKQVTEGLKMGLSGHPYWTMDIGGFFVVNDKYENRGCNNTSREPLWFWDGDYNDGIADKGYCELYTRWIQLGTFLPIFRSHGTDTPREPWQFEKADRRFYDVIVKFIRLRYELMDYILAMAEKAHTDSYIMMRALAFDFPDDPKAVSRTDEYMFGPSYLVAPVFEPMYYESGSRPIRNAAKVREVYLPQGCRWKDYWTGEIYEGGQSILADAPLEKIPVMVRETGV